MAFITIDGKPVSVPDDATPEELDQIASEAAGDVPTTADKALEAAAATGKFAAKTWSQANRGLRGLGVGAEKALEALPAGTLKEAAVETLAPGLGRAIKKSAPRSNLQRALDRAAEATKPGYQPKEGEKLGGTVGEGALYSLAPGGAIGRIASAGVSAAGEKFAEKKDDKALSAAVVSALLASLGEGGGKLIQSATPMAARGAKNVTDTALDFFGNVKSGTANTAGRLTEAPIVPSVESLRQYGTEVAGAVETTRKAAGDALEKALVAADKAKPEGVIPVAEVREKLAGLADALRTNARVPGAPKEVVAAVKNLDGLLAEVDAKGAKAVYSGMQEGGPTGAFPLYNVIGGPRDGSTVGAGTLKELGIPIVDKATAAANKLTAREAKDLLDRASEAIPFDPLNPGESAKQLARIKPFTAWLRQRLGSEVPAIEAPLAKYSQVIDSADAITAVLGLRGAGPQLADIPGFAQKVSKLLRSSPVADEAVDLAFAGVKGDKLLDQGRRIAVGGELGGASAGTEIVHPGATGTGSGGPLDFLGKATRGAVAPGIRRALPTAARAATQLTKGAGTIGRSSVVEALKRALASYMATGGRQ